ncbi:MAG TPA: flavocytochrome C, partial [Hyphomonadaceae bacterium]|nr:flavocytochrome C [Hyphomonadaceae bacterium]
MALDTNLLSRRKILAAIASVTLISASDLKAFAQTRAKVVVIGGGFGGATAARFIKSYLPNTSVTLVEPNPVFTACPFSNLVIGGQRAIAD